MLVLVVAASHDGDAGCYRAASLAASGRAANDCLQRTARWLWYCTVATTVVAVGSAPPTTVSTHALAASIWLAATTLHA